MAKGRTATLACIAPNLTDYTFASIIHGAEVEARKHGYFLLSTSAEGEETFAILIDDFVGLGSTSAISFIIMMNIDVMITLGTFIPLSLIIIFARILRRKAEEIRRESRKATADVTAMIADMFNAVQAIKVNHAETRVVDSSTNTTG